MNHFPCIAELSLGHHSPLNSWPGDRLVKGQCCSPLQFQLHDTNNSAMLACGDIIVSIPLQIQLFTISDVTTVLNKVEESTLTVGDVTTVLNKVEDPTLTVSEFTTVLNKVKDWRSVMELNVTLAGCY